MFAATSPIAVDAPERTGPACPATNPRLEPLLAGCRAQRRTVTARQALFRAGQPRRSLFLVHAGSFKTCVVSEDGREKITGFRMRGDLMGHDALDLPAYACDAIALDHAVVWELDQASIGPQRPELQRLITAMLASEIRRDWSWMLAVSTLGAEQRVAAFLADLADRMRMLGYSASHLVLRMTRAEIGNFLALQLETVTRALSRMQADGVIAVAGREVRILDPEAMRRRPAHRCH